MIPIFQLLTLPFRLLFGLIRLVGRLTSAIIGFALIIAGIVCTVTIVGSFVGIPLLIIGALLCIRALF